MQQIILPSPRPSSVGQSRLHAPPDFPAVLGTLPEGATLALKGRPENADIVLLFAKSARDFRAAFPPVAKSLPPGGMMWAAWPKKASGLQTDLLETVVREVGLSTGLVDVKLCNPATQQSSPDHSR